MIKSMSKHIQIIEKIEGLLAELKTSLGETASKPARVTAKATRTGRSLAGVPGMIYSLVQDGFFKEPRAISEIQGKLRLEGVNKPTTTLSGPLLKLVRMKILTRSKPADGKGPLKYQQR